MRPILLLLLAFIANIKCDSEEPELYYYGLEESERGVPACSWQSACGARLRRWWRRAALVRLCRCARRRRCDAPVTSDHSIELNNRAVLQFCQPVTSWRQCAFNEAALTVETAYARMNPDDMETLHRSHIQLTPPRLTFSCKCREPNYWKLNTTLSNGSKKVYNCASLPLCKPGEFCGNVNADFNALYQSCLCPKNYMCVHNGGLPNVSISELLYDGRGWRAYCQPRDPNYNYEDY